MSRAIGFRRLLVVALSAVCVASAVPVATSAAAPAAPRAATTPAAAAHHKTLCPAVYNRKNGDRAFYWNDKHERSFTTRKSWCVWSNGFSMVWTSTGALHITDREVGQGHVVSGSGTAGKGHTLNFLKNGIINIKNAKGHTLWRTTIIEDACIDMRLEVGVTHNDQYHGILACADPAYGPGYTNYGTFEL